MQAIIQQATLRQYTGERDEAGLCHGHGKAVFSSGQVYDGAWQHGHMHGQGSVTFPDNQAYEGCIAADSITGSGVYTWDVATYEGGVQDGLRHGVGRLTISNSPAVYEGQWQHGKRHGKGVLYYDTARTVYYEGDWCDDMKHGQGRSGYPSGNIYTGSWEHDLRQGHGCMQWISSGQCYTGGWLQGLPDGFGEHLWEQQQPAAGVQVANHAMHVMHNRYVGMFKDGQRHGQGTLFYSSGARYEGQWQHGKKHGQGVYQFEDGSVFTGEFAEDRPILSSGALLNAVSTPTSCSTGLQTPGAAVAVAAAETPRDTSNNDAGSCNSTEHMARPGDTTAEQAVPPATGPSSSAASPRLPAPSPQATGELEPSPTPATRTRPGPAGKGSTGSKPAPAAVASPPAKRASTAASTAAQAAEGATASGEGAFGASIMPAAAASSGSGPGFGPAVSVMQLYIADLLQEYDGQAAATYRTVSNLLVALNTELRLLYDRYSLGPSALLDSTARRTSWALQACQLWELLRDARLLCRHVGLQQVCCMVTRATTPPPAVLQHRQQALSAVAADQAALQQLQDPVGRYNPGKQLLFRDFCELLVRLAAARYPLLPTLEMQLQQVMSFHLLPLLNASGAARPPASASRASVLAAAAASLGSSGVNGGCEQQLCSTEVQQCLRGYIHLLQQLFSTMAAGDSRPACQDAAATASDATPGSEGSPAGLQQQQGGTSCCTSLDRGANSRPAPEASGLAAAGQTSSLAWEQEAASVRQVVQCLQMSGVLDQWQLGVEVVAACLLHHMMGATDPQGARACIQESVSEASYPGEPGQSDITSSSDATSPPSSDSTVEAAQVLQSELLFWMDAPVLLQDLLWGLVRLAAVLSATRDPTGPQLSHRSSDHQDQHQHGTTSQQSTPARRGCITSAAEQGLRSYQQMFVDGCLEGWDAARLLPKLQAILEGPGGLLQTVLGMDKLEQGVSCSPEQKASSQGSQEPHGDPVDLGPAPQDAAAEGERQGVVQDGSVSGLESDDDVDSAGSELPTELQ